METVSPCGVLVGRATLTPHSLGKLIEWKHLPYGGLCTWLQKDSPLAGETN